MGLTGAFQIGQSALAASQLALQVTGNNIANVATPGYSRQIISLRPAPGVDRGVQVGRGVLVQDVRRQVDGALLERLRASISDEADAGQRAASLGQVETILNELTGQDLSSGLSAFFNAWSEGANLLGSGAVIVQEGQRLASQVRELHHQLSAQRGLIDEDLAASVFRANELLTQVADLNGAIADAEVGASTANALRDQRDEVLGELASLLNVSVIEGSEGQADVLVGSIPVVLAGASRGLTLDRYEEDGELRVRVRVRDDSSILDVASGKLAALLSARRDGADAMLERLDDIAAQVIFQVNRVHSTSANASWMTSTAGTLSIPTGDRSLALNDPDNLTLAGLPFAAANGSFVVNVRQPGTGSVVSTRIDVDLDALDSSGATTTGEDTTPEDIRAAIDAIPGLNASFGADGALHVEADPGFSFAFSDDSSGALAVLGVNAFFDGTGARDIEVRAGLVDRPADVGLGRLVDGVFVENGAALSIAGVHETALDELGGLSMRQSWLSGVQGVGSISATSRTRAEATSLVRESLEAQRASLSGVSADEEAVNMLTQQRAYEGAARFLGVVDEMTQVLLSLV